MIDDNEIFPDGEEIPPITKSTTPGNPVERLQMPVGVLDAHLDQTDKLLIPSGTLGQRSVKRTAFEIAWRRLDDAAIAHTDFEQFST